MIRGSTAMKRAGQNAHGGPAEKGLTIQNGLAADYKKEPRI